MGAAHSAHEQDDRQDHEAGGGDTRAPSDGTVTHGVNDAAARAHQDQEERAEDLREQPPPFVPGSSKLRLTNSSSDSPWPYSRSSAPIPLDGPLDRSAIFDHLQPLPGPMGGLARLQSDRAACRAHHPNGMINQACVLR